MKQIDSCPQSEWEDREKYWVSYYKNLGFDLLNISEGGCGVVTKEMRSKSSIERSIEGHKKAIIALNKKDGSFYKEYNSIKEATEDLGFKSKSAISNALNGRSKSAGGYLWIFKEDYNPDETYQYSPKSRGFKVYQFDINGILVNEYPSLRYFEKLEGWSFNGVSTAIKEKRLYHDSYWALSSIIDIDDYEPFFYYQEADKDGNIIEMYRSQADICRKYNLNPSTVCTNIKNNKPLTNGNYISKL